MKLDVMEINEDGSADCQVDLTNEELIYFAKIGIIKVLQDAIKDERMRENESTNRTV